jgi:hypothetical protein
MRFTEIRVGFGAVRPVDEIAPIRDDESVVVDLSPPRPHAPPDLGRDAIGFQDVAMFPLSHRLALDDETPQGLSGRVQQLQAPPGIGGGIGIQGLQGPEGLFKTARHSRERRRFFFQDLGIHRVVGLGAAFTQAH